MVQAVPLEPN